MIRFKWKLVSVWICMNYFPLDVSTLSNNQSINQSIENSKLVHCTAIYFFYLCVVYLLMFCVCPIWLYYFSKLSLFSTCLSFNKSRQCIFFLSDVTCMYNDQQFVFCVITIERCIHRSIYRSDKKKINGHYVVSRGK
jgi:hypothetical protein